MPHFFSVCSDYLFFRSLLLRAFSFKTAFDSGQRPSVIDSALTTDRKVDFVQIGFHDKSIQRRRKHKQSAYVLETSSSRFKRSTTTVIYVRWFHILSLWLSLSIHSFSHYQVAVWFSTACCSAYFFRFGRVFDNFFFNGDRSLSVVISLLVFPLKISMTVFTEIWSITSKWRWNRWSLV